MLILSLKREYTVDELFKMFLGIEILGTDTDRIVLLLLHYYSSTYIQKNIKSLSKYG